MDHDSKQNSAQNQLKNAASSYLKRRVASAVASFLAETVEVWAPIVAALALILVFTISILLFFGGKGAASEVSRQPTPPNNASSLSPSGLFNLAGATDEQKNAIYGFFQEAAPYPTYQKLLTSAGPVSVSFGFDLALKNGWCGGSVDNGNIGLYNYLSCGSNGKRYLFYHESGHTVANRNPDLYNLYASMYNGLIAQDGPGCYSSGFLKSYEQQFGAAAGPINESFAESVAVSILKSWGSFSNFPSDCPATYNWFQEHVLGI